MTQEQFDNYRFSVNTEIKVDDEWYQVREIDFVLREINTTNLFTFYLPEIKEIRN